MADWKQITARIRRARGSRDPAGQLTLLFEKTKDAMVAFELGRHFEVTRDPAQALQWYQTAASRFRRGDWKTKATEAVARLAGEPPAEDQLTLGDQPAELPVSRPAVLPIPEPALPFQQNAEVFESLVASADAGSATQGPETASESPEKKRRRRGRRGGRNRNKKSEKRGASASAVSASAPARQSAAVRDTSPAAVEPVSAPEVPPPRTIDSRSIPRVPVESLSDAPGPAARGRFGDPGLSSRLSVLEMQLRRLLTCTPAKLDHADHAPAGPGVLVLTDDDMTTYYYVEPCDTLRIAISSLARTGTTRRGSANLKPLLAEHLGIPEARVSKYLTEHCVVRWLQLDEGAAHFAHFAIALLRPLLNE